MTYNNFFIKNLISDSLYTYVTVFRSQLMEIDEIGLKAMYKNHLMPK
jgi:hypothetical protein